MNYNGNPYISANDMHSTYFKLDNGCIFEVYPHYLGETNSEIEEINKEETEWISEDKTLTEDEKAFRIDAINNFEVYEGVVWDPEELNRFDIRSEEDFEEAVRELEGDANWGCYGHYFGNDASQNGIFADIDGMKAEIIGKYVPYGTGLHGIYDYNDYLNDLEFEEEYGTFEIPDSDRAAIILSWDQYKVDCGIGLQEYAGREVADLFFEDPNYNDMYSTPAQKEAVLDLIGEYENTREELCKIKDEHNKEGKEKSIRKDDIER